MKVSTHTTRLPYAEFQAACAELREFLRTAASWDRMSEETWDHHTAYEVGCWLGTGSDEKGIVFAVYQGTWDGKIDREFIVRALANPLPIAGDMWSKVIFLSHPPKARPRRCVHCGEWA